MDKLYTGKAARTTCLLVIKDELMSKNWLMVGRILIFLIVTRKIERLKSTKLLLFYSVKDVKLLKWSVKQLCQTARKVLIVW